MFSNPKQFTAATQTLLASQVSAFQALSHKATDGVEKTVALNIAATKASVANSVSAATELSNAQSPQAFFSLTATQATPAMERMTAYGRDLTDITIGMWAEFMSTAETNLAATQDRVAGLAGGATKGTPNGSGQANTILNSAVDHASAGAGQVMKTTRQVVEAVEAQMINSPAHIASTAEKAVSGAAKR